MSPSSRMRPTLDQTDGRFDWCHYYGTNSAVLKRVFTPRKMDALAAGAAGDDGHLAGELVGHALAQPSTRYLGLPGMAFGSPGPWTSSSRRPSGSWAMTARVRAPGGPTRVSER